ncbi:MAG TPA: metallopeptidase family protein [Dehalococcoidia bacterium]|nr:metallopeptidase family protein [Dehalococcoidia bacterium]
MDSRRFRRLVREAASTLPEALLHRVENVSIVVHRRPTSEELKMAGVPGGHILLGLYTGVPLTARGTNYNLVPPDAIVIYQEPIEDVCHTDDEIRDQVRKTVLHELGHYFGIDDSRLDELGLA